MDAEQREERRWISNWYHSLTADEIKKKVEEMNGKLISVVVEPDDAGNRKRTPFF